MGRKVRKLAKTFEWTRKFDNGNSLFRYCPKLSRWLVTIWDVPERDVQREQGQFGRMNAKRRSIRLQHKVVQLEDINQ